jgi:CDGSH-type Zn-finger protein
VLPPGLRAGSTPAACLEGAWGRDPSGTFSWPSRSPSRGATIAERAGKRPEKRPAATTRPAAARATGSGAEGMRIVVHPNGPYRVLGGVPLAIQTITPNARGESWDWTEGRSFEVGNEYFLCRCGTSANMPFCNGSHASIRFQDGLR